MSCSTVVNVTDNCPVTLGSYTITVHYVTTSGDPGSTFGPFASREAAERCLIAVSERTDIKSASLTVNS